jgi:tRNA threonylcarbamoyl adenosine modification protein (Sua5/YciO/YrdC/YwlC family)
MRTFSEHDLDELASELRRGRVAVIPTDTVYGLAAVPTDAEAVDAIYRLKGRPAEMPLPVLAADLDDVLSLLGHLPPPAVTLARAFWPGALTLVVPAPAELAAAVGSTDGTVGVRVPALGVTRRLLARSGPLAVTSANRHGEPPCQSPADARATFFDGPEPFGVLDGGPSSEVPSSVVKITGEDIAILRHGAVPEAELRKALNA